VQKENKMSKINFSVEETVVNLLTQKEFSQRQLEITNALISQQAYPTYFGPDLPKGSKFIEYRIIDIDDIKTGDMITFPGYLLHESPKNLSGKRKTIISFHKWKICK